MIDNLASYSTESKSSSKRLGNHHLKKTPWQQQEESLEDFGFVANEVLQASSGDKELCKGITEFGQVVKGK